MNSVVLYGKNGCTYCTKSKKLLNENNIPFTEIILDPTHNDYVNETNLLKNKANGHSTFPFIFIGVDFLGGFDELNHSLNTNLAENHITRICYAV